LANDLSHRTPMSAKAGGTGLGAELAKLDSRVDLGQDALDRSGNLGWNPWRPVDNRGERWAGWRLRLYLDAPFLPLSFLDGPAVGLLGPSQMTEEKT